MKLWHSGLCPFAILCWVAVFTVLNQLLAECSTAAELRKSSHGARENMAKPDFPPPLSFSRRNNALRIFERVHPGLTIHYNGFSREGSIICYDMLTELRTVEEARSMMDVEFYLLDQMLEHYGVRQHMRIVDVRGLKNMLSIGNFFPWKLAATLNKMAGFVSEYKPILKLFLMRYLRFTEKLVLVNVPSLLVPFVPAVVSRISGAPVNKIVALSGGVELEHFMEWKHIPKEFGNPDGRSVTDNDENNTAWCLMLRDIKIYLGDSALSSEGKDVLAKYGERLLGETSQPKEAIDKNAGSSQLQTEGLGTELIRNILDDSELFDDID